MVYNFSLPCIVCSNTFLNEHNKQWRKDYCESGNVRENFIFANSVKIHIGICDAKKSRLGRDLRILVNDRVISAFREDFIFTKLRICEVSRI